jgi:hypothetical protein
VSRELLFGQLHPDLVCAVALGFVHHPSLTVTADAISYVDPQRQTSQTQTDWIGGDDPLDVITREYLSARREAMQQIIRPGASPWVVSAARKAKETANAVAVAAKQKGYQLLEERGILIHASRAGLSVLQHA